MTDARLTMLQKRQRKRDAESWGAAFVLYLLVFGAFFIVSLFSVMEVSDTAGPVMVRIGKPSGADILQPNHEAQPEAKPEPETVPLSAKTPAPQAAPEAAANTPAPQAVPEAAPQSSQAQTRSEQPAIVRGSENGNSYTMEFAGGADTVRRSLYVPIWLFMPVPSELSNSIYADIPDQAGLSGTRETRQEIFRRVYKKTGELWLLKVQPDYDTRQAIWAMIEEAGFNVRNADYKQGKYLQAVTILFKVSSPGADGIPQLEEVHIESGSGYADIDKDVLAGFKKAQFSNSGTGSIQGRFVYKF